MKKTVKTKKPVKKTAKSGVLKTVKKAAKAFIKKVIKAAPKKETTPVQLNALGIKSQIAVNDSGAEVAHPSGHHKINLKEVDETKTEKRMLAEDNRAKNKPHIVNQSLRSSAKRG